MKKITYQVIDTYDGNKVLVEGTHDTCYFWIVNRMEEVDGKKIFRYWEEEGEPHYDIGNVVAIIRVEKTLEYKDGRTVCTTKKLPFND